MQSETFGSKLMAILNLVSRRSLEREHCEKWYSLPHRRFCLYSNQGGTTATCGILNGLMLRSWNSVLNTQTPDGLSSSYFLPTIHGLF